MKNLKMKKILHRTHLVLIGVFEPILAVNKEKFRSESIKFTSLITSPYHPGTFSGLSQRLMSSLKTSPAPQANSRGSIPLRQT